MFCFTDVESKQNSVKVSGKLFYSNYNLIRDLNIVISELKKQTFKTKNAKNLHDKFKCLIHTWFCSPGSLKLKYDTFNTSNLYDKVLL
jgi:hypothetical protein